MALPKGLTFGGEQRRPHLRPRQEALTSPCEGCAEGSASLRSTLVSLSDLSFQDWLLLVPIVIGVGVSVVAWRLRDAPGRLPLLAMMAGIIIWSSFGFIFVLTSDFSIQRIWVNFRFLGPQIVPAAWLVLALQYTGQGHRLTKWVFIILIGEFVLALGLNLTNDWHGLYRDILPGPGGGPPAGFASPFTGGEGSFPSGGPPPGVTPSFLTGGEGSFVPSGPPSGATAGGPQGPTSRVFHFGLAGPLFWVNWVYLYSLLALGGAILLRFFFQSPATHRWQIGLVLAMLVAPTTANILALARVNSLDLTAMAYAVTGAGFAFSMWRLRFLDVTPIARSAVMEHMTDGVIVVDGGGKITDMNTAAQDMLGVSSLDLIGRPVESFQTLFSVEATLGGEAEALEITLAPGGQPLHVDLKTTPFSDKRGRVLGTLLVLRDTTERTRAEEERTRYTEALEEARSELERLDTMKSRFFTNISHEFRTPLTLILGPVADMAAEPRSALDESRLQGMERNGSRLLRLVNQLLDLSKLEANALRLQVRPVDLVSFVSLISSSFSSLAESRRIRLRVLTPPAPLLIHIDHGQLEKVVVNLVDNAFKYTPEGGEIELTLSEVDNDWISLGVKDTGSGIPSDRIAHVFDRFYEASESAIGHRGGTGIGLALVKEVVELHRGVVSVTSNPGVGTEFQVSLRKGSGHFLPEEMADGSNEEFGSLDLTGIEVARPTLAATTTSRAATSKSLVLVVEDNADMRAYIRGQLAAGFQVTEAGDGRTGRDMALELVPDLVVSDVMMPDMSGLELTNALKADQRTSHIPIVLLTARTDEESRLSGLGEGADDYLPKPFNSRELVARVENLIAQRRQLRERYGQAVLVMGPTPTEVPAIEAEFLERLRSLIELHLAKEDFQLDDMAGGLNMSKRQLNRKLNALTNETPGAFLRRMRLEKASQLLEQRAMNVGEVGFAVGFNSPSYFAQCFRQHFGKSPTAFVASLSQLLNETREDGTGAS